MKSTVLLHWFVIVLISLLSSGQVATAAYGGLLNHPESTGLNINLTIKENAGVNTQAYPTSAVIPLPRGQYTSTANLGIAEVPSQVEVLERWPQDGSLRHVLVHFQADAEALSQSHYHFTDSGRLAPPKPILITDTTTVITTTTGPLRFTVSKTAFNILDQAWFDQDGDGAYSDAEQIISSNPHNGGVFTPRPGAGLPQYDSSRNDLHLEIEERGPLRAVIRAEALTRFITTTDHTHGFAVRIYAYAGMPYVKIDYQLQNSAKNVARAWPLYFEEMNLDFRLALAINPTTRTGTGNGLFQSPVGNGLYLAQEMHNRFRIYDKQTQAVLYDSGILPDGSGPEGFLDVSDDSRGVTAIIRNFWQTWPNGLEIDNQNKLSLQIFPHWSAQWYDKKFSPSGLYWLEDMQHVYKETLLYFHGPGSPDTDLVRLARTFQYPPVATIPADWYRQSQATLDLGGVIPPASVIPAAPDQRQPFYHTEGFDPADWYNPQSDYYGAGWANFYDPEPGYRSTSCTTGGWPYSAAHWVASGNPGDFFTAEGWAMAELNLRPQWVAQYTHTADWPHLQLSENAYCNGRWRIFSPDRSSKLSAPPLFNTGAQEPTYYARDDQHGWFYHVAEAYFLTGNPWIRDWYRFITEFRHVRLERLDPYPDTSSRATGHVLNHALQAYRVTGDATLLERFQDHLNTYLRPEQDPYYGDQRVTVEDSGGGFQTGYLMRAIVDYLEEVHGLDWQAYAEGFNYLSGLVEWNYNYGNFPYYFNARDGDQGISSGTGLTLVDPQAWYYWHTGKQKYLDQINAYMEGGIHGGEPPYGEFNLWSGQFEGRYYLFVKNTARNDVTPPATITDLVAATDGSRTLLQWTAPAGAARYHIVWSTKPVVEQNSTNPAETNWWAANPNGPSLIPTPGARQSLLIDTGGAAPVYAAIFTFDQADNLSAMSNVALAASGDWHAVYLPLAVNHK